MMIDWFAVDVVCSGGSMRLHPPERRAVVRRMSGKMFENHLDVRYQPGKVSTETLGTRMFCTSRTVARMRDDLPPADKRRCPVCGCDMWVWNNLVVEPHADALHQECPMSNNICADEDWEQQTALNVVWLAQRLRAGDAHGVWEHISGLSPAEGRYLLIAALAGVSVDSADPFAWLSEEDAA